MKSLVFGLMFLCFSVSAETIKIYSPYSSGHSGTTAMMRILEQANAQQKIYNFILEPKPGGNQIIAVKAIDPENSLAIIAAAFVENTNTGKLNAGDYTPIHSLGVACWVGMSNTNLQTESEIIVGTVGIGNATHLTALAIGQKYKKDVRYIGFKSNNDAILNLAGNNGINFSIDRYELYQAMKTKNQNLKLVGASCPTRMPEEPNLKTFKEMGIETPYVFNITVAHKDMNNTRKKAISTILNQATIEVGQKEIYKLSSMKPPIFDGISDKEFYDKSVALVTNLQNKYKKQIEQATK
jgi:hypothetical protein